MYDFHDDTRLAILQARHEALYLRADELSPAHLALGVLHTLGAAEVRLALPAPGAFESLCLALGGRSEPAPVIASEILYSDAARDAIAGAMAAAAGGAGARTILPLHLLAGILSPRPAGGTEISAPGPIAVVLERAGLGASSLQSLLALPRPR